MAYFFQFEADFVQSLRCIPMIVRFKLDTCGIKLKLPQWNQLSSTERQMLVEQPCSEEHEIQLYRELVQRLVLEHTGETATDLPIDITPDWMNKTTIPDSVQAQALSNMYSITLNQWAKLTPLQRFTLLKLSRSNHENKNFLPALNEFF